MSWQWFVTFLFCLNSHESLILKFLFFFFYLDVFPPFPILLLNIALICFSFLKT